jgi:TfoX/Sxy family transcriptional regulator of competence genes
MGSIKMLVDGTVLVGMVDLECYFAQSQLVERYLKLQSRKWFAMA